MPLGDFMCFLEAALPETLTRKFVHGVGVWQPLAMPSIVLQAFLISLAAQALSQESSTVRLAREADQSLLEHNYDVAIADYQQILQINSSSAAAWSNLGAAWFARGNVPQASNAFVHAARLQPANRDYSFNAGLALVREDKCDASAKYLKLALLSPQHRAAAQYLLGLCAFVSQNWQDAKDSLLRAEAVGSDSAETYYMLSIAARKSRDPEQAKRAFDILRSKFPDSSLLHELVGELSDRSDMDTNAQREMTLAISGSPTAPGLHAKLGFLLWKAHRFSEAQELFQQELTIDPHSYSAMHFLGDIAEKNNQLPQASAWYQRALREQPQSGEAHFAAGRVLELQGRSEDALGEFRASFPALESDASAHYWTAKALRKLGLTEQANLELLKVQEINSAERKAQMAKLSISEP